MNEDDTSEIDLPFSQHPDPVTRGFLFVGMIGRFGKDSFYIK